MLRNALKSLPKTLDDTYTRILCEIDDGYHHGAFKILQWLTDSTRPLALEGVAEVIAIDVEASPRFHPDNRLLEPKEILMICSSLISLEVLREEERGWDHVGDNLLKGRVVVRLAHFSVKEFLVSERIRQGKAKPYSIQALDSNIVIYNDCLAYLMDLDFDPGNTSSSRLLSEFPLAWYAAQNWTYHARITESVPNYEPYLGTEFFSVQDNCIKWKRLRNLVIKDHFLKRNHLQNLVEGEPFNVHSPLYHAAAEGLPMSVAKLLDEGAYANAPNEVSNALDAASVAGHDNVVQVLLDRGADANASSGTLGTALHAASCGSHKEVVQMLLGKRADINAKGGPYGTALQVASSCGRDRVVQVLLDEGADVNLKRKSYPRNVLQEASFAHYEQTVQILLEHGADINAQLEGGCPRDVSEVESEGHIVPLMEWLNKEVQNGLKSVRRVKTLRKRGKGARRRNNIACASGTTM